MEKRSCVELNSYLLYDDSIRMFVAYFDGSEERAINISSQNILKVHCAESSDVLFLLSCSEKGICYAKNLEFNQNLQSSINSILDEFKVERVNKDACNELPTMKSGEIILYEEGFIVLNDEKKECFGKVPVDSLAH